LQIDSQTKAGAGKAVLVPLLSALRSASSIFFLLNVIDLPEYFQVFVGLRPRVFAPLSLSQRRPTSALLPAPTVQDNMADWMGIFHAFLSYRNAALAVAEDDVEEGPVEGVQSAILVS
jgi:hypothetical protein